VLIGLQYAGDGWLRNHRECALIPCWRDIPIHRANGQRTAGSRSAAEEAGMNGYLAKPFKREDLQATASAPGCELLSGLGTKVQPGQ